VSDYTAIRAASRTLKRILTNAITNSTEPQLAGVPVDLKSPKEMGTAGIGLGVSLWLYRVTRDGYALNTPAVRASASQSFQQQLPIDLYYLITPIADDAEAKQVLLGRVLQAFNDHASLGGSELLDSLAGSKQQLRVALETLTVQELTQVWYALSEPYQLSISYSVQLVTIDSDLEPVQVAPVMERDMRAKQILAVT
jgi:hypothetical protein